MNEKIARQKRRGFQRVSQSVVSQKKYFGETAKMKLFLLVTFFAPAKSLLFPTRTVPEANCQHLLHEF